MTAANARGRTVLYSLVFLSGAAGLVYQVVWHKYLSILLGAQARATAIVLAIFLGGISLGYTFFGRWSRDSKRNLLLLYAAVELGLAFWAFAFPVLFRGVFAVTPWMYRHLGVSSLVVDILASVLLVGFPTFLMGGTLPLLTQGLSDDLQDASRTHAKIYGINTVGACFGSLAAGYVLIPWIGLADATVIAGMANLFIAVVTHLFFVRPQGFAREAPPASATVMAPLTERDMLLFAVGVGSGFYIITLETVLIRLMGLSTGSSNFNFTLIVSLFVLALGVGSLVPRKLAAYSEKHLLRNQVSVAFVLFLLYLSGDYWSYWVHLVRIVFRDDVQNFYYFQAAMGMGFFMLLAVPIGLCGFTLPLCFHLLKERKETLGFRVGQLYGLNTLGCVVGAIFGGYLMLYAFNLDILFKICVGVVVLTAVISARLFARSNRDEDAPSRTRETAIASSVLTLTAVGLVIAPLYHRERFIQPFRQQSPIPVSHQGAAAWGKYLGSSSEYLWFKDGPNTSVGVGLTKHANGEERSRTIFVNGKSDGNTRGDALTMALTGHLPGLFAKQLDRVAVIGFGTGITVGSLLQYPELGHIDVVEIADTVLQAAKYFDRYNGNVTLNPLVKFNAMDAFRFMGGNNDKFNVIISEPSNPWVAGVENLFSSEFYQTAHRKLEEDGMFVQWVQVYSFDDELLKMVLRTITGEFPHVAVFQMLEHDLALIATNKPLDREAVRRAETRFRSNAIVRNALGEQGITQFETLLALELIPSSVTRLIAGEGPIHQLETPRLSHGAAKSFFTGDQARVHSLRRSYKEFYPAVDQSLLVQYLNKRPLEGKVLESFRTAFCDNTAAKNRALCEETLVMSKLFNPTAPWETAYEAYLPRVDFATIQTFKGEPPKKNFTAADLRQVQKMFELFKRLYSPIAQIPIAGILDQLEKGCIAHVPASKELYGDCLLEVAAVMEVAIPEPALFGPVAERFSHWFVQLAPNAEGYERFKKANEIILKLVRDLASTPHP